MKYIKKMKTIFMGSIMAVFLISILTTDSDAITAWARKYGVDCSVCHISGYKLTRAGQTFLRLGHKMPGTSDKEENLSDYFSITAKIRGWNETQKVETTSAAETTKSSFEAHALSIYSGGPLDSGFSYFAEMYLHENDRKTPATSTESTDSDMGDWGRSKLAEMYLQYNTSDEESFFTARGGRVVPTLIHFHNVGGRLASSRPDAITTSFGDNPYRPYSRQYGVTAGYSYTDIFVEGGIVNGTGKYENTVELGSDTEKDVWLTADYALGDMGSMLGLYYYKGKFPLHLLKTPKGNSYDDFSSVGLIGNYTIPMGAIVASYYTQSGKYQKTSATTDTSYDASTMFAELQGYIRSDFLAPYLRYEIVNYDPDRDTGNDKQTTNVATVGIHVKPFQHGRFVFEYTNRYKEAEGTTKTKTTDNNYTLEVQYMF